MPAPKRPANARGDILAQSLDSFQSHDPIYIDLLTHRKNSTSISQHSSISQNSRPTSGSGTPRHAKIHMVLDGVFDKLLGTFRRPSANVAPAAATNDVTSTDSSKQLFHSQPSLLHSASKPPLSDVSRSNSNVSSKEGKFWRRKTKNTDKSCTNNSSYTSAATIVSNIPATARDIPDDTVRIPSYSTRHSTNSIETSIQSFAASYKSGTSIMKPGQISIPSRRSSANGGVRFGGTEEQSEYASQSTIKTGSSVTLHQPSRQSFALGDFDKQHDMSSSKSSLAILDPIYSPADLVPIAIQPRSDSADSKKSRKRSVPNINTRPQQNPYGSSTSLKCSRGLAISHSTGEIASTSPSQTSPDTSFSPQSSQSSLRLGKLLGSMTSRAHNISNSALSIGLRNDMPDPYLRLSVGDSFNSVGQLSLHRPGSIRPIRVRDSIDQIYPPVIPQQQVQQAGTRRHSSSDDVFAAPTHPKWPRPQSAHQNLPTARRNPSVDMGLPKAGMSLAASRSRSVGSSLNNLPDNVSSSRRSLSRSHQVVETTTIYHRNESPVSLLSPSGESETTQGKVNQYYMVRDIGSGAYGRVVLCRHEETGVYYACKIISKSRLKKKFRWANAGGPPRRRHSGEIGNSTPSPDSPTSTNSTVEPADHLTAIKREIAILKKLSKHPNINALIEVLDDASEDNLYMIFELCEYGPVMKIVPGELVRPFSEDMARKYFRDVVMGLEYLHFQRIIHRDIKPENLLLTADHTVQIADFGISHMFQEGEDDPLLDDKNTSPLFSPPEACATETKHMKGKAVDVWALGVTLYCFVHGCCPFEDPSIITLCRKITAEDPLISPNLSPYLQDLLERMLNKDPENRISLQEIKVHPWVTLNGAYPMMPTEENCVLAEVTEEEVEEAFRPAAAMMFVTKLMSVLRGRRSKPRNSERPEKLAARNAKGHGGGSRARSADILNRPDSESTTSHSSQSSVNTPSSADMSRSTSAIMSRWALGSSLSMSRTGTPSGTTENLRELPFPPHPLLGAVHGKRSRSFDQAMLAVTTPSFMSNFSTSNSNGSKSSNPVEPQRPRSGSVDSAADTQKLNGVAARTRTNSSLLQQTKSTTSMHVIAEEH
ncbi:hypothetical protein SmJEL517_g01298 [Synchytrium microbalum]|uniref:Protein kinase domain-containing protein n=1 Tax=Synchytrium microbalum TaxID=1806994 RepID=A0A507CB66_9FUNG|nr:uncharacterized protein SmJEL517_g01298 [Synchytrium microbalum]TPX36598.1 hypothetical protein SmJEL517_g01298 [Synchytrium microbalum]